MVGNDDIMKFPSEKKGKEKIIKKVLDWIKRM
jgi:hypothetical protein